MQISPQKVVSLTYTLKLSNGDIADETTTESPFAFIHGVGQTLPEFDSNLEGLKAGESFSFSLTAEQGYGSRRPDMIIEIPKSVFDGPEVPKDILQIGNMVPMQDQSGNPLNGTIVDIADDKVTMDFNHPLADEALHFSGVIIEVRDASPEEIDHGHVHGPGGHHH